MKKKLIGIFIGIFIIGISFQVVGGGSGCTFQYEIYDIGVGEPTNIHDGDYRLPGEDSLAIFI